MSCEFGTCWYKKGDGTIQSVYVFETGNGKAEVLFGNLKNLNPDHTVETENWEHFDDDPTLEQILTYVIRYRHGDIPINPKTGKNDDIWIESIPEAELMTTSELMEHIQKTYKK